MEIRRGLPGDELDKQARYLEAEVKGLVVGSVYLPNGNPQPGPKFDYKLAWFERLIAHAATLCGSRRPVILAGDFNVPAGHARGPDAAVAEVLAQLRDMGTSVPPRGENIDYVLADGFEPVSSRIWSTVAAPPVAAARSARACAPPTSWSASSGAVGDPSSASR